MAEALDLAYASTGYGNQGVTAERSATWVGLATTGAGLYVGATRGRWQNSLHVVARDREHAREVLVAALGRDRSDRGLGEARTRAEAGRVYVSTSTSPRCRRSAAELDRAEARARAELSMAARPAFATLEDAPRRDRSDLEAVAEARAAAEAHRQAAEAERSRLPATEEAALADNCVSRQRPTRAGGGWKGWPSAHLLLQVRPGSSTTLLADDFHRWHSHFFHVSAPPEEMVDVGSGKSGGEPERSRTAQLQTFDLHRKAPSTVEHEQEARGA